MRLKKSILNSAIGMISFLATFLPVFIVRKVFVVNLGSEMLGLSSLYTNVIGYLSIIEMGIGSAIIYSLYKPFAENDKEKIKGYLKYYEKFYLKAGFLIFTIGLFITPFLHLFIKDNINVNVIRVGFLLTLINTFTGYLFTYKHCILNAAQEGYKISIGITSSKILISIFQIIIMQKYKSFYGYLLVQILINLIFYILINKYIDRRFLWLKSTKGYIKESDKYNLVKNIKALFYHKIGGIFVFSTDNIVVSSFINLKTVAAYNNYTLITSACAGLMWQATNGISASIGNLIAVGDKEDSYKVHKKLFFISFWVGSFIVISLFNTISQFIGLWVGPEYMLDIFTISIILFNLYFQIMRESVEKFKEASGEYYKDRYAPLVEGIVNLIVSIILVNIIGLPGVFLGTLISNLCVVFWVKPKIVYKYVFNRPLKEFFKMYIKHIFIAFIPFVITTILTNELKNKLTVSSFIINCMVNIIIINSIYFIIFRKNNEFIYFKNIFLKLFKKIILK